MTRALQIWHLLLLFLSLLALYYMLFFFDVWIDDFGWIDVGLGGAVSSVLVALAFKQNVRLTVVLLSISSIVFGALFGSALL